MAVKSPSVSSVSDEVWRYEVDSTVRYLDVELEDALSIAERIDI